MMPRRKQGLKKEFETGTRHQATSEKGIIANAILQSEHNTDLLRSAKQLEHESFHGKRRRKTGFFFGDPNLESNNCLPVGKCDALNNNNSASIQDCSICSLPICICKCSVTSALKSEGKCTGNETEKDGSEVEEVTLSLQRNCIQFAGPTCNEISSELSSACQSSCQSSSSIELDSNLMNDVIINIMPQVISESTNQSLIGTGPIMTTFPWQLRKDENDITTVSSGLKSESIESDQTISFLNFKNAHLNNSSLTMLSSVYGINPKSNIETVLCGLNVSAISEESGNNNTIKPSFLNRTVSELNVSVNTNHTDLRTNVLCHTNDDMKGGETPDITVVNVQTSTDALESKTKFSNIKNPQILEQHISKIISENAAIVQTLDPLWTKKNTKLVITSSSSQNVEKEIKRTNELLKNRCLSEDGSKVSVQAFKSKLHSALLGKSNTANSVEVKCGTSPALIPSVVENSCIFTQSKSAKLNSHNSAVLSHATGSRTKPSEECTVEGSIVKSLLCLKQTSNPTTEKCNEKHPENPEGSIIKDLLLKTRKSSLQSAEENKNFKMVTLNGDSDAKSKSSLRNAIPVVYICVLCDIGFRSKENLDIHQKHYCKGNKHTEEFTGQILKNQLLGLVGSTSPPLKKRKISEPVMPVNRTKVLVSSKAFDDLVTRNKMPQLCAIDRSFSLGSSRNASASSFLPNDGRMQLASSDYPEEVILCTGAGHPDSGGKLLSYSEPKTNICELKTSIPSVVVTIAKPILNSGGTIVHSSHSSASTSIPLVNLEDHDLQAKYGQGAMSDISGPTINKDSSTPTAIQTDFSSYSFGKSKHANSLLNTSVSSLNASVSTHQNPTSFLNTVTTSSPSCTSPVSSILPFMTWPSRDLKRVDSCNTSGLPAFEVTPSLSPVPSDKKSNAEAPTTESKKYLAPTRPTTLSLNKKAITLIGSTIVSPETPRPKKSRMQLYLNGQAYTYLGMKCSTRPTYCCIYRPQPMFVLQETDPKLSMYSNWQVVPAEEELSGLSPRQYFSLYNSQQERNKNVYSTPVNKAAEDLVVTHSSYWSFRLKEEDQKEAQVQAEKMRAELLLDPKYDDCVETVCDEETIETSMEQENSSNSDVAIANENDLCPTNSGTSEIEVLQPLDEDDGKGNVAEEIPINDEQHVNDTVAHPPKRVKIFQGGFKSNEDYTYIRGRGRGKYVCEECGIRCKKPSMLKKHIRTHTDLRPFKCRHCAFAFKTKGNLTKHMKSKAHHKKCLELGIVPVPTTIDDSQIDGIALSKQFSDVEDDDDEDLDEDCDDSDGDEDDGEYEEYQYQESRDEDEEYMSEYEADDGNSRQFEDVTISQQMQHSVLQEKEAAQSLLDLSSLSRPSKWPTQGDKPDLMVEKDEIKVNCIPEAHLFEEDESNISEQSLIGTPRVLWTPEMSPKTRPRSFSTNVPPARERELRVISYAGTPLPSIPETSSFNKEQSIRRYSMSTISETRKMVLGCHSSEGLYSAQSMSQMKHALDREDLASGLWLPRGGGEQPMDLRVSRGVTKEKLASLKLPSQLLQWSTKQDAIKEPLGNEGGKMLPCETTPEIAYCQIPSPSEVIRSSPMTSSFIQPEDDSASVNSGVLTNGDEDLRTADYLLTDVVESQPSPGMPDYNTLSPISPVSVEDEGQLFFPREEFSAIRQFEATDAQSIFDKVNEDLAARKCLVTSHTSKMMHRSEMDEGKCTCSICNKTFSKPSQLRLHVNIHYFERPFRCDSCAVSFRTKGHLQKHKRSVSHYNKVNMNITFGTPTTDNPRPFKCADCKIAFRIHGHLAKHLRSKMHIMKLECLGKLPFGMYAEMERSGVNLNEIDTTDCDNSLESLQAMAQRLYNLDPRRMRWQSPDPHNSPREKEPCTEQDSTDNQFVKLPQSNVIIPVESVADDLPAVRRVGVVTSPASVVQHCPQLSSKKQDVKQEISDNIVDGHNLVSNFLDVMNSPRSEEFSSVNKMTLPDSESSEIPLLHRSGTCHLCGRLFKSAKFLQVHLYYDHQGWTEPVCNTSSEPSKSPEEMLNWKTNHERPGVTDTDHFNCEICGRHFLNHSGLQQHMLSHAQLRPFVCEVCDAGFTTSVLLAAHIITHQQSDSMENLKNDLC